MNINTRLFPEGSQILVMLRNTAATMWKFSIYTRDADGVWNFESDTDLPAATVSHASPPTRGPNRRIMLVINTTTRVEYELSNGSWQPVGAPYSDAELGVATFTSPRLSPDGLRMTAFGRPIGQVDFSLLYFDRPTLNHRFSSAVVVQGIAVVSAMLAEDCSRLYINEIDSLFVLERIN